MCFEIWVKNNTEGQEKMRESEVYVWVYRLKGFGHRLSTKRRIISRGSLPPKSGLSAEFLDRNHS